MSDTSVSDLFAPVVLGRLPSRLLLFVPRNNLQEMINFIKKYDSKHLTYNNVMRKNRQLTERPAIQYMKIIDELAELRKGTPLMELESWAWDMLMDILPENMITVAASLGIVDKPTREQLKKFDDKRIA